MRPRLERVHKKVWIAWGRWWAWQLFRGPYFSLGVHIDFRRPYVDLHLCWLIISVGRVPHITQELDRYRHSCRGFLFTDNPIL